MWQQLSRDSEGGVVVLETILIGLILLLGMIVTVFEVHSSVISQISDVSASLGDLPQTYPQFGVENALRGRRIEALSIEARYPDLSARSSDGPATSIVEEKHGESQ